MAKVAVLLATYNGITWLTEQVNSVLNQSGVDIEIYVSDDYSEDGSYGYMKRLSETDNRINLLPQTIKFGSAGKNFYRLMCDVEMKDFDYFAFCDQDDIWYVNKIKHHIQLAQQHQADGVSSNVTAFWPDGTSRLIIKSQVQRKWDYLFESAGPGCTFLMTPWLFGKFA